MSTSAVMSLDTDLVAEVTANLPTEVFLISASGARYPFPSKAIDYSPYLGLRKDMLHETSEFNLGGDDIPPDHTLYHCSDKYIEIVAKFLTQMAEDDGEVVEPMEQVTVFDADAIFREKHRPYWEMIRGITFPEVLAMDNVALYFGLDKLKLWNECRVAFHIKDVVANKNDAIENYKHLIQRFIDRDVIAEAARRKREEEAERRDNEASAAKMVE